MRKSYPDTKCQDFFKETRRVKYEINFATWQWQEISNRLGTSSQSLTIVNTTNLAREGFTALSEMLDEQCFHLSARMVPAHRKTVLKEVFDRLDPKKNLPCHLISTQVVEAGIDLDFPLVFRQMAPLDSIIQAAGRCNRENNLLWQDAVVQVFDLENANYPSPDYNARTNITREILKVHDLNDNLLEAIDLYYSKCYSSLVGDKHDIQKLRRELKFEQVSEKFKVIDNEHQFSAFVPWGEGAELLKSLDCSKSLSEANWRKLQPYTVNLPKKWESIAQKYPCGLIVWPLTFYSRDFGASDQLQQIVM
jgi:CRISPR-associated endonuclease/helicase Cas3